MKRVLIVMLIFFVGQTIYVQSSESNDYFNEFYEAFSSKNLNNVENVLKKRETNINGRSVNLLDGNSYRIIPAVLSKSPSNNLNDLDDDYILNVLKLLVKYGLSFKDNISNEFYTGKTSYSRNGNLYYNKEWTNNKLVLVRSGGNGFISLIAFAFSKKIKIPHSDNIIKYMIENEGWDNWYNFVFLIIQKRYDLAKLCLNKGFDINKRSSVYVEVDSDLIYFSNVTPVFVLVARNDLDGVKFLIGNGADVNKTVKVDKYTTSSPLALAESNYDTKMVNYLKGLGAIATYKKDSDLELKDEIREKEELAERRARARARAREDDDD